MIREAIEALVSGRSLEREEAAAAMREVMEGAATPAQLAALLVALRLKGETPEEIAGMAQVMREKALRVVTDGQTLVDTCGTGGDGKGTFNISTAAAFVAAACGLKVAKHGNRAASGACGSADLLEALGVNIGLGPEGVARCIQEAGIGFMFAPVFHPAMKHAAPVRRELGIRTVFNVLGPLTNPAGAQVQVLGVPHEGLGETMARVLALLGVRRALVVHGADGVDEVSLSGPTRVWDVGGETLRTYAVAPEDAGLAAVPLEAIRGGDAQANAALLRRVFQGEHGPLRDVVLLNAAAVLVAAGRAGDLREGVALAARAVDEGAAAAMVEALAGLSQRLA